MTEKFTYDANAIGWTIVNELTARSQTVLLYTVATWAEGNIAFPLMAKSTESLWQLEPSIPRDLLDGQAIPATVASRGISSVRDSLNDILAGYHVLIDFAENTYEAEVAMIEQWLAASAPANEAELKDAITRAVLLAAFSYNGHRTVIMRHAGDLLLTESLPRVWSAANMKGA